MFYNVISRQLFDTASLSCTCVMGDPPAAHSDSILLVLHLAFRRALWRFLSIVTREDSQWRSIPLTSYRRHIYMASNGDF